MPLRKLLPLLRIPVVGWVGHRSPAMPVMEEQAAEVAERDDIGGTRVQRVGQPKIDVDLALTVHHRVPELAVVVAVQQMGCLWCCHCHFPVLLGSERQFQRLSWLWRSVCSKSGNVSIV